MFRVEKFPSFRRRVARSMRGFTLVELMVVVAVIGVLASVAVPKFLHHMQKGKRTEAEVHLVAIAKGAEAGYVETASFPQVAAALTPAVRCCQQAGRKCAVVGAEWNGVPAWDALGFEMTQPFYFQYGYESAVTTEYEARAVGDLDCDGRLITYRAVGDATTGSPTTRIIRPNRAD